MDGFFRAVDNVVYGINEWFKQPIYSYCVLETAEDDYVLTGNDGSLVSILELEGSIRMIGEEEQENLVNSLSRSLGSRMNKKGHSIQIVIDYDPTEAKNEIQKKYKASRNTALNLGFDIDSVFDNWEKTISKYCSKEKVYIVLWTRPFLLTNRNKKIASAKMRKNQSKSILVDSCYQRLEFFMDELKSDHLSFVDVVKDGLFQASCIAEKMEVHDALFAIRKLIDPEYTSNDWRPLLPGDKLPNRLPEPGVNEKKDISSILYPSLKRQLFPREGLEIGNVVERKYIEIGDRIHAPQIVELPPQHPEPFQKLFDVLRRKKIPWRVSFFIDSEGLKQMAFKDFLASIFFYTSSANKKFIKALKDLKEIELSEPVVRIKISFSTWVKKNDKDPLDKLRMISSELASSIQSWGVCDTRENIGDPLLGFCSTIPALCFGSPAPGCAAPLEDVLYILPITRPTSPWRHGSLILRSPDGKPMPYMPNSSRQNSWIDIGVAPMGGGKSVWLNTYNYAFCFQPGISRIPYLSIIDIGPSSKGLIDLLRALLPPDKKYLAVAERLKMNDDYCINPFDTPLGCRKPLPSHLNFLVNFMSLLATPLDQDAPQDGIPGLARMTIEMAYSEFSDDRNPKMYNNFIEPKLHEVLLNYGFHIDENTTWWEIVDMLFEKEDIYWATKAQTYAVPMLGDVAGLARRETVKTMYKHKTPNGELITDYFWRACTEAIRSYPILKSPTKFDLGSAQIVSLDLDEVAPRGGADADRQSGVMYMLARHVVGSKFFMMPSDVKFLPKEYREYHGRNIKNIRQDPKRLCYDEVQRFIRSNSVMKQIVGDLESSARESRKWNLSIGLYSQSLDDYPDILIELATCFVALGAGTQKYISTIADRFGFNDAAVNALGNIRKPGAEGGELIGYFKTDQGNMLQMLVNTVGSQALWAFSSTTEDSNVRNELYERIGVKETLEILSFLYPGGVKKEIEKRKNKVKTTHYTKKNVDIVEELIDEIEEIANKKKRS